MKGRQPIVVFFDGPAELAIVQEILGADARYYNGVAEGSADAVAAKRLIAAGLTVEAAASGRSGLEPPPNWLGTGGPPPSVATVTNVSANPVTGAAATSDPPRQKRNAKADRHGPRRRVHIGGVVGGLMTSAGILILLQQLALIDPRPVSAVVGLAAGALAGLVLTLLAGRR